MRRSARLALLAVGAAALAALVVLAFLPEPIPVEVGEVRRGLLEVSVCGEGKTRVKDRFVVSAPLAGLLHRVDLEAGDPVEAGTVLVRMEPTAPPLLDVRTQAQLEARVRAARAGVERAEAELARARTALDFARGELRRARQLAAEGFIPQRSLEAAQTDLRMREQEVESARFAVQVARHELETARAALVRARNGATAQGAVVAVRSPVEGRVLRVLQESQAVVNAGTPILEVGDPAALEVVLDLLSTDAVRVSRGDRAVVEQWGGGAPLEARVRLVEPSGFTKVSALGVEEQRVNVLLDFVGPPESRQALGDAFRVEACVVVWSRPDALKVPASALFRHGDAWAVFVVVDGRARRRAVEIGRQNDLEAELLSGLEPGARVILYPSDRVEDGVAVEPLEGAAGG